MAGNGNARALEDSLGREELGPVNVDELQEIEKTESAARGVPAWAVIQDTLIPIAQRAYRQGRLDARPRAASLVMAVLHEAVRATPDALADSPDLPCAPVRALTVLGTLHYSGALGRQDYAKARECYERAAAKGGVQAMLDLGYCHQYGHGAPRDVAKAFDCYLRAYLAAPDLPEARCKVADMHFDGLGTRRDERAAVRVYRSLLAQSDALGDEEGDGWLAANRETLLRRLAAAYRDGRGTPRDPARALECCERLELIHYRDLAAGRPATPYYSAAERLDGVQRQIAALRAELDGHPM